MTKLADFINRIAGWKTWNDRLAILLFILIVSLWVTNRWIHLPGEVLGATISVFTAIAMFYYRKAPKNGSPPEPPERERTP